MFSVRFLSLPPHHRRMRMYLTADLRVRPTLEFRCCSVAVLQGVQVVQVVPEGEITIRGGTEQGTGWYRHFDEAPLVPPSPTSGTASDGLPSLCSPTCTACNTQELGCQ